MNEYREALNKLVNYELIPSVEESDEFTIVRSKYLQKSDTIPEEDLDTLSELVDKTEPVEPTFIKDGYVCPTCKNTIAFPKQIHNHLKYCFCCGQALDWRDNE